MIPHGGAPCRRQEPWTRPMGWDGSPKQEQHAEVLFERSPLLVQAMLIWLALFDLKLHVLHGQTFHAPRGPVLIPIVLVIVALTVGCFFLNAVFAHAVAQPGNCPVISVTSTIRDARSRHTRRRHLQSSPLSIRSPWSPCRLCEWQPRHLIGMRQSGAPSSGGSARADPPVPRPRTLRGQRETRARRRTIRSR